jgi:predicted small secreted protein
MNSIIASKQKGLFAKKTLGMAGAAALIIAALFLAGCNTGVGYDAEEAAPDRAVLSVQADPSIYGTWRYEYDYTSGGVRYAGYEQYVIVNGSLTYTYHSYLPDVYDMTFTADIVSVTYNTGNVSGVIIIHYGATPPPGDTPYYYNAVYFNNQTMTTVQLANAVNLSDGSSSEVETLKEAQTKFTWANVSNYVNWNKVNPQTRIN